MVNCESDMRIVYCDLPHISLLRSYIQLRKLCVIILDTHHLMPFSVFNSILFVAHGNIISQFNQRFVCGGTFKPV